MLESINTLNGRFNFVCFDLIFFNTWRKETECANDLSVLKNN
jgi:hypothetical protein